MKKPDTEKTASEVLADDASALEEAANGQSESGSIGDDEIVLAVAETLTGDIASFLTDRIKNLPKVWAQMADWEQRDIIQCADLAARTLVTKAVRLIAADDRPTIVATLEIVTVKDGIKGVVTLGKTDEQRHALMDSVGQAVLLVVADADQYKGGTLPKPDAKEPELPLGDNDKPVFDATAAGAAVGAEEFHEEKAAA